MLRDGGAAVGAAAATTGAIVAAAAAAPAAAGDAFKAATAAACGALAACGTHSAASRPTVRLHTLHTMRPSGCRDASGGRRDDAALLSEARRISSFTSAMAGGR